MSYKRRPGDTNVHHPEALGQGTELPTFSCGRHDAHRFRGQGTSPDLTLLQGGGERGRPPGGQDLAPGGAPQRLPRPYAPVATAGSPPGGLQQQPDHREWRVPRVWDEGAGGWFYPEKGEDSFPREDRKPESRGVSQGKEDTQRNVASSFSDFEGLTAPVR